MLDASYAQRPTKVLVNCAPPILGEVVSLALAEVPGVELISSGTLDADVVVASVDVPNRRETLPVPMDDDQVHLILFDPAANLLGLRRAGDGMELRSGGLETLLEVVQLWSELTTSAAEQTNITQGGILP